MSKTGAQKKAEQLEARSKSFQNAGIAGDGTAIKVCRKPCCNMGPIRHNEGSNIAICGISKEKVYINFSLCCGERTK